MTADTKGGEYYAGVVQEITEILTDRSRRLREGKPISADKWLLSWISLKCDEALGETRDYPIVG